MANSRAATLLGGTAIAAVAWTVPASMIFLAGTGLLPQFPHPYWQWWLYLPHAGENETVRWWLMASAAVPTLVFGLAGVARLVAGKKGPRLRPGWFGAGTRPDAMRALSDNHGHADWMPIKAALAQLQPSPAGEPALVIGEAYRVDQDSVAGVPFDPANRKSWGKGGSVPLLWDACLTGPTHSIMFAGSGGLKTSSAITRLLNWTGSAIVLDPSREIGPMIAPARKAMGQAVAELGLATSGLDILGGIDPRSPSATRRLLSMVGSLCGEEPERGDNAVFSDAGRNMVAAILAHVIWDDSLPAGFRNLLFFRELITTPEAQMKAQLAGIAVTTKSSTARLLASTLMGLADDTFSGAYFSATQFTAWLFDDAVADMLSFGAFTVADVVKAPTTVFVQVPLDVLITTPAVARVILDALAWAFIEADGAYCKRTLMLVDEAGKIGPMKSLQIVRDTGRKYGLTLHMLYLSEGELSTVWGKEGPDAWFQSVSWRGYAGGVDRDTAKRLSEDVGEYGVLAASEGDNSGSSGKALEVGSRSRGRNTSTHEIKRRLILPNELREARADEMFVIRKSGPPIRCGQAPYFRRKELLPLVAQNRFARTQGARTGVLPAVTAFIRRFISREHHHG